MNATVSVIVPCYNAGMFIARSLKSVGEQTFKDWELIAVDDAGPEDGTAEVVRLFAADHPTHRIKWIRHPQNRGVSAARNSAILAARGSHIALLDPDDYWSPSHLEKAMNAFALQSDIAVCASQAFLFRDSSAVPFGIERYEEWEAASFPWILGMKNAIPASSAVISQVIFDKVGFFDVAPELQHCEDYDFWLRLVDAGCQISLLGEPTVYYRKHEGGATSNLARMKTARHAVVEKHKNLLFMLQREALEHLCGALRNLYAETKFSQDTLNNYGQRLNTLELTISNVKSIPAVSNFLQLRRWLLGNRKDP